MNRDGWARLSAAGDKLGARWIHDSGWIVFHCGHPTANWPYAAYDPEHPGTITADLSGRGFRNLARAFGRIEGVLSGLLQSFNDGLCKHGHRRVICDPADIPAWLAQVLAKAKC